MTKALSSPPVVLSIAGFDPSGGAGIIVDVRTIAAFGCKPVAAVTSLTFQNSFELFGAIHESADSLRAQLFPIIEEHTIAAVKIGMLPTAELVREIVGLLCEKQLPPPVIDPVMQSSSGDRLIERDAIEILVGELLPLARLITPNLPEAEKLTGHQIIDEQGMRDAAQAIRDLGAPAVLLKGGHLSERIDVSAQQSQVHAIDVLNAEDRVTIFTGDWIEAQPVRGTGCMLSSAIAACLGQGIELEESVR